MNEKIEKEDFDQKKVWVRTKDWDSREDSVKDEDYS